MANTYYDPGEQRAAKVGELFARIAPRYDLMNDLQSFGLHRYWKRRVVQLAQPRASERALDLCCGTGDLAQALSQRGASVVGADFSHRMLEVAQHRTSSSSRFTSHVSSPAPHYVRADALHLPFPANSFDVITIGYGLRNLASWEAGLREMRRVAKPGGRILVLDFGKPDNVLWRRLYFGYMGLFVPCLGRIFCGSADAYAYILESLHHYPAQRGVEARMRELGMVNVRLVSLLGGVMSINYGEKARETEKCEA